MGENREVMGTMISSDAPIDFEKLAQMFEPDLFKSQEKDAIYLIRSTSNTLSMERKCLKKTAIHLAESLNRDFDGIEVWRLDGINRVPIYPESLTTWEPIEKFQIIAVNLGMTKRQTRHTTKSEIVKLAQIFFPFIDDVSVYRKIGKSKKEKVWSKIDNLKPKKLELKKLYQNLQN